MMPLEENMKYKETCMWKYEKYSDNDHHTYDTSCKNSFQLIYGNFKCNDYFYCPNCGKRIEEIE
jgi:predicted RNA-binding Zn-ribbon protein involved in translation (DUF1610 family)